MVSVEDSYRHSHSNPDITSHYPQTRPYYYYTPPPSSARISRSMGWSMRKIRSNIFKDHSGTFSDESINNLSESFIDLRLGELAAKSCFYVADDKLENSRAFSVCSSDISGELQRLASLPDPGLNDCPTSEPGPEPCSGFSERDTFSPEIIDIISLEDLEPTVKLCIEGLQSSSSAVKRSAAAKLRLLAKNRADNRALIGESGAVPALIPLLRCSDPVTQEHAVTALLNLSLHESNKSLITESGAVKALIYVLKTGTEISKQNAACALLSLALIDENRMSIGASGAIPPLIALLINGSNRGKKDSLTTLYKLCSVSLNKERAVCAGAIRPLLELVGEQGDGLAEKAMVVLSSLAVIEIGVEAIVEEGGLCVLVEVIEDGSDKMKEFAVLTLVQLCAGSVRNRGLLVREGAIPPLVALSQIGTVKAKHKAETLLRYLREPRPGSSSRSP